MDIQTLSDHLNNVILYIAIGLICAFIIVGLLVWKFKKDRLGDFKKYAVGITVGFALTALVLVSYVEFQCNKDDMQAMLFYPILATLICAIVGSIATLIGSLFSKKVAKYIFVAMLLAFVGCFIAIMVVMSIYYKSIAGDENLLGLIISAVVAIITIVALFLLGNKQSLTDTRAIVYGAISIALSFALSYARLFRLPQGGSVTFASLLPLMIYCCMFGTRRGVVVCVIYGTLQALQDPYIIHPMQFLLDYPLAFGLIGASGIFVEKGVFKNKKVLAFMMGGIVAVILRYLCHVCTGVFAFASYADLNSYATVTAYSFAYNAFTLVDMAISLACGGMLFASKSFRNAMQKSSSIENVSGAEQEYSQEDDLDEIDLQIIQNQQEKEENNSQEST